MSHDAAAMPWRRGTGRPRVGVPRPAIHAPPHSSLRSSIRAWIALALLLGCAPGSLPPFAANDRSLDLAGVVRPAPCMPSFPFDEGWLGGDAVYSVSLSADKVELPRGVTPDERPTLWLFGDSFVGSPEAEDRRDAVLVHNSVARSRCRPDGRFEIDYYWRRAADGAPRAIFETGRGDRFWWPLGGFVFEGALYVGLVVVAPMAGSALSFETLGVDLVRVSNPGEDPRRWQLETAPLSREAGVLPAGGMLVEGAYVYLFGSLERQGLRRPRFLTRLNLDALRGFGPGLTVELETLVADGSWAPGLEAERARIVMDDDATEMSVAREPGRGVLRAVYSFPYQGAGGLEGTPSEVVYTRTAERPEGPWSAPRALFVIPDLRRDSAVGYDPARRCYSAKAHPDFGTPERIVVTYVCNLLAPAGGDAASLMARLIGSTQIYRPRVVSWPRPGWSGGASHEP